MKTPQLLSATTILLLLGCDATRITGVSGDDDGGVAAPTARAADPDTPPTACTYPEGGCRTVSDCPPGYTTCAGCNPDPCHPELNGCYGVCMRAGRQIPGCRTNDACPPGEFCQHQLSCTDTGECRPRPQNNGECDTFGPPVCGCDGKTYGCEEHAWGAGVSVASEGACTAPGCEGISCGVIDDCCGCHALDALAKAPPPCPACDAPVCQQWSLAQPFAYCLAGRCLLTDQGAACSSDSECVLHDDCCLCAALPKAATRDPDQCPADCEIGHCEALGLDGAHARCVDGQCRVALP